LQHRRNVSAEYFSLEHTNFDHAVACIDIRSVVVAGVGDLQDNSNVLLKVLLRSWPTRQLLRYLLAAWRIATSGYGPTLLITVERAARTSVRPEQPAPLAATLRG
jgi:hypothetical protein